MSDAEGWNGLRGVEVDDEDEDESVEEEEEEEDEEDDDDELLPTPSPLPLDEYVSISSSNPILFLIADAVGCLVVGDGDEGPEDDIFVFRIYL